MAITEENLMKLLLTEVWAVLLDPLNDDEASSSISSKVLSGAPWRQERERWTAKCSSSKLKQQAKNES